MPPQRIISPTTYPPPAPGAVVGADTDGDGIPNASRQAVGHQVQRGPTGPWVCLSKTTPISSGANFTEPVPASGYVRVFSNEWVHHPSLHMLAQMPVDQVGGNIDVDLDEHGVLGNYALGGQESDGTTVTEQYAFLSPAARASYYLKLSDGTYNTHPGIPRTGSDFDPREYDCTVSCQTEAIESEFHSFDSTRRYPIQNFTGIIFPQFLYDMVFYAIGICSKRLDTDVGDHLIAMHVFDTPVTVLKTEQLVYAPFTLSFTDTFAGRQPADRRRLGDMIIANAGINIAAHDPTFAIQTTVPLANAGITVTAHEPTFEILP